MYFFQMDMIARTTKQIGAAVRRYRRQRKLTQAELGQKVDVRQATISKLEAGEPGTQLRVLVDSLAALDLELLIQPRSKASMKDIEDSF
jgi:HTH-type transcriptional regulator/antitoxin HipB